MSQGPPSSGSASPGVSSSPGDRNGVGGGYRPQYVEQVRVVIVIWYIKTVCVGKEDVSTVRYLKLYSIYLNGLVYYNGFFGDTVFLSLLSPSCIV